MLSRKGNARRLIFSVACRPRSSGSKHPFSSYQLRQLRKKKEKKSFYSCLRLLYTYPLSRCVQLAGLTLFGAFATLLFMLTVLAASAIASAVPVTVRTRTPSQTLMFGPDL